MLQYPIFFNHVPKCAGTSINELFCRPIHKSAAGRPPFVRAEEVCFMDGKRVDAFQFIGGHLPHRLAARRFQDWSLLTVIRQPWKRFISLTRHIMREQQRGKKIPPHQTEFLELLSSGQQQQALEQTAGWYPTSSSIASYFQDKPREDLNEVGKRAKDILSKYDLVLLTENLNKDWNTLERYLQGTVVCAPSQLNSVEGFRHQRTPLFEDSLESIFESQFPYEYDFYRAAQEVYPESIGRLEQAVEKSETIGRGNAAKVIAEIDWEDPIRCGGLSDRIVSYSVGYEGRTARKLEASEAVVEMDVPATEKARIEFVFWLSDITCRRQCQITINGTKIDCFTPEREVLNGLGPHQVWTSAEIPAEALQSGVLRIAFDRSDAKSDFEMWILNIAVRPIS